MLSYIDKLLDAFSQVLNTLLGGNPRQPLSSRLYEGKSKGIRWCAIGEKVVDTLLYPLDGHNHCHRAHLKFLRTTLFTYGGINGPQ